MLNPTVKAQIDKKNQLFNLYENFYLGTEYKSEFIKRYFKLYSATREFYSLISRAVDINVELIPGGWKTTAFQPEINAFLDENNWRKNSVLYTHFGSLFGETYLKIYGAGYLQPLDPRGVWLGELNGMPTGVILRNELDYETGQINRLGEVYTPQTVKLYLNEKLVDEYSNPYGFVPLFYAKYKDAGINIGLNAFHSVIESINAVNEMATFLQEQMLRSLINQKVITGAQPTELEFGPDKTIFLPQGAVIDTLKGDIDVTGALEFIKDIKAEVKQSLPEFVFDSLKAPNLERPNSAEALNLYSQELITKIRRARVGFDQTLKLAINAARLVRGLSELDFYFDKDRSVLPNVTNTVNSEDTNGI